MQNWKANRRHWLLWYPPNTEQNYELKRRGERFFFISLRSFSEGRGVTKKNSFHSTWMNLNCISVTSSAVGNEVASIGRWIERARLMAWKNSSYFHSLIDSSFLHQNFYKPCWLLREALLFCSYPEVVLNKKRGLRFFMHPSVCVWGLNFRLWRKSISPSFFFSGQKVGLFPALFMLVKQLCCTLPFYVVNQYADNCLKCPVTKILKMLKMFECFLRRDRVESLNWFLKSEAATVFESYNAFIKWF